MKVIAFTIALICSVFFGNSQDLEEKKSSHFNFWIGEWNVYKYGTDTLAGISRIESILDSTALLENYETPNSKYKGKSLNKYNSSMNRWEQYWVDNSGLVLHLSGNLVNGKMILSGTDDQKVLNRITWSKEGKNVRQTWDFSKDEGRSWKTAFDGEYRKK